MVFGLLLLYFQEVWELVMLVMGESGEVGIQKETHLAWPEVIPLFLPTPLILLLSGGHKVKPENCMTVSV